MKYKVVYFTRTGNSERIAKKIADSLSSEIVRIVDNMNWNGFFGFLKAGYYSISNKKVEINDIKNIESSDEIILVSPLWAGNLAVPVRVFLDKFPYFDNIHLVVTSAGSKYEPKHDFKSIHYILGHKNEDEVIQNLITSLKK